MTYIPVSDDANLNDRISMLIKKKRKKKGKEKRISIKRKKSKWMENLSLRLEKERISIKRKKNQRLQDTFPLVFIMNQLS